MDKLERVHGGATGAQEQKKTSFVYDGDHERRRKEQLRRLYNRTQDQLDEEELLKAELRKIEARKKEREKKTADLQKMIAQADASQAETKKLSKKQKLANQVRSVMWLCVQLSFNDVTDPWVDAGRGTGRVPTGVPGGGHQHRHPLGRGQDQRRQLQISQDEAPSQVGIQIFLKDKKYFCTEKCFNEIISAWA